MNDELRKAAGTAVDVWDDTGTRHEDVVNAMNDLRKVLAKNANAAPFDFHTHLARQAAWSSKTFGPGDRAQGVVDHIRKELREIEQAPGDLEEWIDVVILALDGAWRSGATPEQIIAAIVAKQTKNEARNWPDWRTADPSKAIEHVKELPNAAPQDQDAKDAALRSIPDLAWEIYDHWDNDREMKVGKCLMALAGRLKNYDPRFTAIHDAIAAMDGDKNAG